ncbi:TonB-dependent receptor plug domain-containing protein [Endozoicomonas atrinae]|uniref:TonB-dependent receptor plug domain-containing protein n=1 Tax=Endozoicomonas atrinae TaxID=1333660 RepID=UPI003B006107
MALGASFASTAAYSDEGESVEKLEKIQVTGSRISRVDAEGASPVTVITREEIDQSGAVSVADVLRSMTENGAGSYSEKFTNSFAPGSASVSLRGLGSSRTLVLLNGRRVANFGFAQNVNETGVDLNSIPLSAVERVEVLKDGASAIYGSDAIAGVVNVILKKDFEGAEVSTSYGQSIEGDGQKGQMNLVTGKTFGDTNVMLSLDYYNQDDIMMKDRENSASANQTANGGYDFRSSRSIYPLIYNVDTDTYTCNDPTGAGCRYDYSQELQALPPSERYGLLGNLNHDFDNGISAFGELSYTRVITDLISAPTPHFASVTNQPAILDPANPNNPNPGNTTWVYSRYADVGQRLNETDSQTYRAVGGLTGAFSFDDRDVDWETSVGYSLNNVVNKGRNYIDEAKLNAAIADGSYDPTDPTGNSEDVISGFRVSTKREADSDMKFATLNASMPLMELPTGEVYMALGTEWRAESIEDTPDPLAASGGILGSGGTGAKGDRSVKAAYAEFAIPLHDTVEMQMTGRWENYSDFGNTIDPKVALRWQPLDNLMIRGSYTTSFKAPTLPELFSGDSVSYLVLEDTTGCEADPTDDYKCEAKQYQVVYSGNEELDAEEAETFNLGFVYEPIDRLELKLDLYKIRNTDMIDMNDSQTLIDEGSSAVVRDPVTGRIQYVSNEYVNIAQQMVEGADIEAAYTWDVSDLGRFKARYKSSYIHNFKRANSDGQLEDYRMVSPTVGGSGPHLKTRYSLSWDKGDYQSTATINYDSSYKQRYEATEVKVDHLYTLDLQFVYSGFEKTKLTFGVDNVTNEEAPFWDGDYEGYEVSVHDNTGTYVYGKLNYVF